MGTQDEDLSRREFVHAAGLGVFSLGVGQEAVNDSL
jgi:hypothetical protein